MGRLSGRLIERLNGRLAGLGKDLAEAFEATRSRGEPAPLLIAIRGEGNAQVERAPRVRPAAPVIAMQDSERLHVRARCVDALIDRNIIVILHSVNGAERH